MDSLWTLLSVLWDIGACSWAKKTTVSYLFFLFPEKQSSENTEENQLNLTLPLWQGYNIVLSSNNFVILYNFELKEDISVIFLGLAKL